MRNLFWILLLANVILFAVMQGGGIGWSEQEVQPQPELNGDMIRLIARNTGFAGKVFARFPCASPCSGYRTCFSSRS